MKQKYLINKIEIVCTKTSPKKVDIDLNISFPKSTIVEIIVTLNASQPREYKHSKLIN